MVSSESTVIPSRASPKTRGRTKKKCWQQKKKVRNLVHIPNTWWRQAEMLTTASQHVKLPGEGRRGKWTGEKMDRGQCGSAFYP